MKLTKGVINGLQRALGNDKTKHTCDSCGFKVPIYAGSYARKCPNCGETVIPLGKNQRTDKIPGKVECDDDGLSGKNRRTVEV